MLGLIDEEFEDISSDLHPGNSLTHEEVSSLSLSGAVQGKSSDMKSSKARSYKILKPLKPLDIIYDCTHDNPTPVEKFKTGRIALSHLGLLGMADTAIASTWGYD